MDQGVQVPSYPQHMGVIATEAAVAERCRRECSAGWPEGCPWGRPTSRHTSSLPTTHSLLSALPAVEGISKRQEDLSPADKPGN